MSHTDLPETDRDLLQRAGTLLDTVARHSDDRTTAALECLQAADYLSTLGLSFSVTAMPVSNGDATIAIKESLQLLAKLSTSTFGLAEVVAATDAAQRAYQASSRG